jgi:Raf kinase inhibitor-like YbhB/YbcL family protein
MLIRTRVAVGLAISAWLVVACSSSSSVTSGGGGGGSNVDSGAGGGGGDGSASGSTDAGGGSTTDAGSTASDSGAGADASTPLVLTSTLLTNGGTWPVAYACSGASQNQSPPLAWSGGPSAKSYAIVMVDAFFVPPKVHWLIYDMGPGTASLAGNIPAGYTVAKPVAHQSLGDFAGAQFFSPCPPVAGGPHTYEITIHALDVATLPGVTMTSTATDTNAAVSAHTLASAKMSLTFSR